MRRAAGLAALEERIGHGFAAPELLAEAVTHPSMSSPARADNQRLEFLGDRVLGLVVAEALLAADPGAPAGALSPRLAALVRKETCADVARDVALGDALRLGRSETLSGGRRKQALLGDAMEAVIAAVYLDAGYDAARALVLRLWGDRVARVAADARDAKTALQERARARGLDPPEYVETGRSGPAHRPVFTVAARLSTGAEATATAGSKREAQQAAARALLGQLDGAPPP